MLIRHRLPGFANPVFATKFSLGAFGVFVPRKQNVIALITPDMGRVVPTLVLGKNIVTNAGDIYYAERGAAETPTNDFNDIYLSTVNFIPAPSKTSDAGDLASTIAGATLAEDATYPQTNDPDTDNTGAGTDVVTHRFSFNAASFNDTDIDAGCIAVNPTTFGSGADPLLTAFDLTAFAKTATDTLKMFVNHTMNGV